jgi:hypothetical protein
VIYVAGISMNLLKLLQPQTNVNTGKRERNQHISASLTLCLRRNLPRLVLK